MSHDDKCSFLMSACQVGRNWKTPAQSLLWRDIELMSKLQVVNFLDGGGGQLKFRTTSLFLRCEASTEDHASQVVGQCQRIRALTLCLSGDDTVKVLVQSQSLVGTLAPPCITTAPLLTS